ncbi:MAG: InlB B-repeat-containing protein [Oscillospiraceae bacterium]|jgi:uncharacterized repeat protein (TIGR02543 family)|nr:InlB B-repeat-containing protein [Oscillospiraceae bacterium]
MTIKKRIMLAITAATIILTAGFLFLPMQVKANEIIQLNNITASGTGWTFENNVITILNGANVTLRGTAPVGMQVVVVEGASATITLDATDINANKPIELGIGSNVTIVLEGGAFSESFLSVTGDYGAGIYVNESASLTITGTGELTVSAPGPATNSAGIAGSGDLIINNGNIKVNGSGDSGGFGIGGSLKSITINGGELTVTSGGIAIGGDNVAVTINGGYVFTTGGSGAAGIDTSGNVIINGGEVRVAGGSAANAINCENLIMNGNGVLFATAVNANIDGNLINGIFFNGNTGILHGDVILQRVIEIDTDSTLTIAEGRTLTITRDIFLHNYGTINNYGTIISYGVIQNYPDTNVVNNLGNGTIFRPIFNEERLRYAVSIAGAIEYGDAIKLAGDISDNSIHQDDGLKLQLTIERDLTLDLAGFELEITIDNPSDPTIGKGNCIELASGVTFIIMDSVGGGHLNVANNNNTINDLWSAPYGYGINTQNGTLIINSGKVSAIGGAMGAAIGGSGTLVISGTPILDVTSIDTLTTIESGNPTITGDLIIIDGGSLSINQGASLTIDNEINLINNGTFTVANNGILINNGNILGDGVFNGVYQRVTWNSDGGTPAQLQTIVPQFGTIQAPTMMVKPGFIFDGWFTNADFSLNAPPFPIINLTDSRTFYAKWVECTHGTSWSNWVDTGPIFAVGDTNINQCITDRTQIRTCSLCNQIESRTLPATGHSFNRWVITIEPAVGVAGQESRTCANCNIIETRRIPPIVFNVVEEDNVIIETISDVSVESISTTVDEGSVIIDSSGNEIIVEDMDSLTVQISELPNEIDDILEQLISNAGSEEVIAAIESVFESLKTENFDMDNVAILAFDISIDYAGNKITDLGHGAVYITFAVPEEFRVEGMRFVFFGIHQNPDGSVVFLLIDDDIVVDENGNITIRLSQFSNYFLVAAPPLQEVSRTQVSNSSNSITALPELTDIAPPPVVNSTIPGNSSVNDGPTRTQPISSEPEETGPLYNMRGLTHILSGQRGVVILIILSIITGVGMLTIATYVFIKKVRGHSHV